MNMTTYRMIYRTVLLGALIATNPACSPGLREVPLPGPQEAGVLDSGSETTLLTPTWVELLAGSEAGYLDGPAASARFTGIGGIVSAGSNDIYFSDSGNHRIRRLTRGVVSTLAGSGPESTPQTPVAGTFADGPALEAGFVGPGALVLGPDSALYLVDRHRIRRIKDGVVSTYAGTGELGFKDGPVGAALFAWPRGLAFGTDGTLYVADRDNHRIRAIRNGMVSTFAGSPAPDGGLRDGPAATALFKQPVGVAVGATGIYVADSGNARVRKISDDIVTTLAGGGPPDTDGPAAGAGFDSMVAIAVGPADVVYVLASAASIREISNGFVRTFVVNLGARSQISHMIVDHMGRLVIGSGTGVFPAATTHQLQRLTLRPLPIGAGCELWSTLNQHPGEPDPVVNTAAAECQSGVCVGRSVPPAVGVVGEPRCTRRCDKASCPKADASCPGGYTCAPPEFVGPYACCPMCLCRDEYADTLASTESLCAKKSTPASCPN